MRSPVYCLWQPLSSEHTLTWMRSQRHLRAALVQGCLVALTAVQCAVQQSGQPLHDHNALQHIGGADQAKMQKLFRLRSGH